MTSRLEAALGALLLASACTQSSAQPVSLLDGVEYLIPLYSGNVTSRASLSLEPSFYPLQTTLAPVSARWI